MPSPAPVPTVDALDATFVLNKLLGLVRYHGHGATGEVRLLVQKADTLIREATSLLPNLDRARALAMLSNITRGVEYELAAIAREATREFWKDLLGAGAKMAAAFLIPRV